MKREQISTGGDSEDRANPMPTVTLAKLYEKQGFLEKAASIYRRLLSSEPERVDLKEELAAIRKKLAGSIKVEAPQPIVLSKPLTGVNSVHREEGKMLDQADEKKGTILVVHGPNLNMLGGREPSVYGTSTLHEIDEEIKQTAAECGMAAETFQSNHEGEIVEKIHEALAGYDALIINPAAYTHTSIAIRDALLMLEIPVIEVHLSNVHGREPFRHKSMIADVVTGQVVGFGKDGYLMAVKAVSNMIRKASLAERQA